MTAAATVLLFVTLVLLLTAAARIRADERRPALLRVPTTASGRRQTGR